MEIRIRTTGAVMTESEFRAANRNTSFPQILSAELLADFDADPVLNAATLTGTRYQTVVRDGVEEIDGKWFTKFTLVDMADEEKAAMDAGQAQAVRETRTARLAKCDWTQLQDSPVDKAAWATYRQQLRDITEQAGFPWEVQWPAEPA